MTLKESPFSSPPPLPEGYEPLQKGVANAATSRITTPGPVPTGFESFQGHLKQCILNCIVRKNAIQRTGNFFSRADKDTLKAEEQKRLDAIRGALDSILQKAIKGISVKGSQKIEQYAAMTGNVLFSTSLKEHLEQCFLNCIARKNLAQQAYNKTANYVNREINNTDDTLSSQQQRLQCIINVLSELLEEANNSNVGDTNGIQNYKVVTALKDAAENLSKNALNSAKSIGTLKNKTMGGKKTRKYRKARKARKSRKVRKSRK